MVWPQPVTEIPPPAVVLMVLYGTLLAPRPRSPTPAVTAAPTAESLASPIMTIASEAVLADVMLTAPEPSEPSPTPVLQVLPALMRVLPSM